MTHSNLNIFDGAKCFRRIKRILPLVVPSMNRTVGSEKQGEWSGKGTEDWQASVPWVPDCRQLFSWKCAYWKAMGAFFKTWVTGGFRNELLYPFCYWHRAPCKKHVCTSLTAQLMGITLPFCNHWGSLLRASFTSQDMSFSLYFQLKCIVWIRVAAVR